MEPKVFLVAIGALFTRGALGQFTQPPPTTADPNTIKDCTWWHVADTGDTCESVRALYDLSAVQFVSYVSIWIFLPQNPPSYTNI